jgi:hypothetical protein
VEDDIDLAVLELEEPAPTEIPRYRLYAGRDEIGRQVVLAGYGDTGFGDTGVDSVAVETFAKRAGLNRLEDFYDDRQYHVGFDFDSGAPENNAFDFLGIESDLGFGPDEVLTSRGDSGGPVFVDSVIAGVTAFNAWPISGDVNDEFDQSWGEVGFATRVSSFAQFIISATNGEVVFVPEPSSSCPFWIAFLLLAWESKRQRDGFNGRVPDDSAGDGHAPTEALKSGVSAEVDQDQCVMIC